MICLTFSTSWFFHSKFSQATLEQKQVNSRTIKMNRPILKGNGLILLCIMGVLTCQTLAWNKECHEKCGGQEWWKILYEGKAICIFTPDMPDGKRMVSNCTLDCEGLSIPASADIARCFCEMCKVKDERNLEYGYKDFCRQPGVKTYITEEECEEVCAGSDEIKFRARHCFMETEEGFKQGRIMAGLE